MALTGTYFFGIACGVTLTLKAQVWRERSRHGFYPRRTR